MSTIRCGDIITRGPWADVRAYGAVGDGVTDDTAAIELAKVFAVSSKRPLVFTSGTFRCAISLSGTDDGLIILGLGEGKTYNPVVKLIPVDTATDVISIASGCNGVTIEGMLIDNDSVGNDGTHNGIYATNAAGLTLRRVLVKGFNNNILIESANTTELYEVYSSGAVYAAAGTGHGLYISHPTAGTSMMINHSHFMANDKDGLRLENLEGPWISNVEALLNKEYNLIALNTNSTWSVAPWMSNCQFDSSGEGSIYYGWQQNGVANNIWISSMVSAAGAGDWGIKLYESKFNSFTNLQVYNNTGHGLEIVTNSNFNTFTTSVFINCGIGGTKDGVNIADSSKRNAFTNCLSYGNTGYGFNFQDVTLTSPNFLISCRTSANILGDINVQDKDVAFLCLTQAGTLIMKIGIETVTTGSPALKLTVITKLDSSGGAITGTLADGTNIGEVKTIIMTDATTSSTITVANHITSDPEVFTFAQVGDSLTLMWNGTDWMTIYNNGVGT